MTALPESLGELQLLTSLVLNACAENLSALRAWLPGWSRLQSLTSLGIEVLMALRGSLGQLQLLT